MVIIGDFVLIHATKAILDGEEIYLGDGEEEIPSLADTDPSSPNHLGAATLTPAQVQVAGNS
jgi:hypothetical protein